MKKTIIIMVLTALIAAALGLSQSSISPIITAAYCKIKPSECSKTEEEK